MPAGSACQACGSRRSRRSGSLRSPERRSRASACRTRSTLGPRLSEAPDRCLRPISIALVAAGADVRHIRGPLTSGIASLSYDVHSARLFGKVADKTGIVPFMELVEQVMTSEPYRSAAKVYSVVDNGPSHEHRPAAQIRVLRLPGLCPLQRQRERAVEAGHDLRLPAPRLRDGNHRARAPPTRSPLVREMCRVPA